MITQIFSMYCWCFRHWK